MEKSIFSYCRNIFLSTANCVFLKTFTQAVWKDILKKAFHRKVVQFPQDTVEIFQGKKLQAGIDIGCNIPDIVLKLGVSGLQGQLHLADGVKDRGVVPVELPSNVGQAQVGHLADHIHGHLPGLGHTLVFLGAPEDHLVHAVELADLGNDQAGGGQGIALGLEHIVNGPGNVGQGQLHAGQVVVGHDLFDRTFDLTDIICNIDGNVVAHIVI